MATIGTLEHFDTAKPSSWDSYYERLECFLEANKVTEDKQKRAVFLSVCGPDTYSIIRSLVSPDVPTTRPFNDLIKLIKSHFSPKPSEIFQRYLFYRRKQLVDETVSSFVSELRKLSEHCNFGDSLDTMLRDRLVCGIKDENLQRRLLSETSLTFADALDKAIAAETASQNVKEIRNSDSFAVRPVQVRPNYSSQKWHQQINENKNRARIKNCSGCGGNHPRVQCKFKDAECHSCKKKGHISRVCRNKSYSTNKPVVKKNPSKNSAHLIDTVPDIESLQLKYVYVNNINHSRLQATVKINGSPLLMEVDSGAKVSIIDCSTFKKLFPANAPKLEKSPYELRDYNKNSINILGQCTVSVEYSSFNGKLPILIAKEPRESLLGTNWFESLGIGLVGVHSVNNSTLDDVIKEFSDVFKEELGTFKGAPISLKLDPAVHPIQLKARTVPYALKQKIEKELQRLEDQGAIEPVDYSDWTTPVVPILKSNGEIRLCGDYKCTLNKALGQYPYPVPAVNQVLAELAGSRHFIKLDLSQAYLQLTVDEASAMAQTIVTHKGAFRCTRLQFGISSAPGIFQQFIDRLLSNIPGVLPYFDDVLIKGSNLKELTDRFRQVLKKLSESGLRLNRNKCIIGASSIQYLGFHIDEYGIKPTKDKVQAIHNAPTPKSKEELQAFLGLMNFYHAFLKNKANVAEPLHRLLDKGASWTWTRQHDKAFTKVKELLSAETLLTHFDEKKPIIITCDASQYGIGAVLSHRLEDGVEAPIAYYSRTMNSTERRYAQIDKEALAIIQGVRKFHNYLYGHEFEIRTDHKPLLGLLAKDKPIPSMLSPRMQRWSILLSSYDFNLVYRPGKEISNADGLSRLPQPVLTAEEAAPMEILLLEALKKPLLKSADLARLTAQDPTLSRVLNWVWRGWPPEKPADEFEPFFNRKLELSAHKGCLLWGSRVVIPKKVQADILGILHNTHQGIVKTKALARSYVWWPGIDKEIENLVCSCELCQQTRNSPPKTVIPWENTRSPWTRLHIDHAGPFQNSTFLIVVDAFSKWLEVVRVPTTNASSTINALRKLFSTHGIPDVIVSDNGTGFVSEVFQNFLERNGIRFISTAPRHPSSNGQAERMVQTTKNALKRIISGNWDYRLSAFLMAQHTTPNATTGMSPAELLMNRRLKTCLDKLHPDLSESINAKSGNSQTNIRMFAPLDTVYALGFPPYEKWVPATVLEILGMTTYVVQTIEGRVWKRHIDQLRRRIVSETTNISNDVEEICVTVPRPPMQKSFSENSEGSSPNSNDVQPAVDIDSSLLSSVEDEDPTPTIPCEPPQNDQPPRPVRKRHPPAWLKDYRT